MKRISVLSNFFVGLMALAVLIGSSSPGWAQKAAIMDADYWFDKGALCATYGNNNAAINYFQKVIDRDPNRSDAYFAQGISYGQLEEFFKAIPLINKAIEMEPQNGLYFYGRARVYLLAGENEKAMQDFKKAAELDNEDAMDYIDMLARTP